MEHIRFQEFTIHAGETVVCSNCDDIIADYGEKIYRAGYWIKHDLHFCNAACVRVYEENNS